MPSQMSAPERSRQPEPIRPVAQQPVSAAKNKKGFPKKLIIAIGATLLLLGALFAAWSHLFGSNLINKNDYQAVFLTNGQVYFGKLHKVNGDYFKLTDIYYLQVSENLQPATGDNAEAPAAPATPSPQLIKLGKELHGPRDEMVFNESQVLFFENITEEGTVGKAIKDYKSKQ